MTPEQMIACVFSVAYSVEAGYRFAAFVLWLTEPDDQHQV